MKVLFPSEINVSTLEYSEPKPFGDHAKIVYVNHDSNPVYIQTPFMKCPYGLGKYDDGEKTKYSLDLSFSGVEESNKISNLKEFLEKFDNKILDDSTKHSLEWFKKKKQSRDVASALFSPSVKIATENGEPTNKYPPTFKLKVPNYNNSFKVQCFDETKTKLEPEMDTLVTKGHSVSTIVKLSGIWFAGGKFGVSWELVQMKLTPKTAIQEYAFQDESDNDDDEVVEADDVELNNDDEQNYVVDSDEDL